MSLYQTIINLLKQHNISFKEYSHDPILSYEDALREKGRCKWNGIESKNVFLKSKSGKYFIFVTVQGQNVDFKKLKEIVGEKCSLASNEDVINVINCVPGCVCPFGFPSDIQILIDENIFKHNDYLFSPGVTDKTIQCNVKDLKVIWDNTKNNVQYINV